MKTFEGVLGFFERHKVVFLVLTVLGIALYIHLRKKSIKLYAIQGDPNQGTGDYFFDPVPLVEKLYEAAKNDSYLNFSAYFYDLYDEPVSVLINLNNADFKTVHNVFNARYQREFGKKLDELIMNTSELSGDLLNKYRIKRVVLL